MNFCLYFPYLRSDIGEMRHDSACDTVIVTLVTIGVLFFTGVDFLEVKNPWSSLRIVTESAICNAFNAVFIQSSC